MSVEIKISGVREIQKKFESLTPQLRRKLLRSAITKAARVVAMDAKGRVPVRTGALRKSIKVAGLAGGRAAGLGARAGGKAAPVGKRVKATMPYAHIIERQKPYLAPAADAKRQAVQDMIRDDVAKQIRDMGKK